MTCISLLHNSAPPEVNLRVQSEQQQSEAVAIRMGSSSGTVLKCLVRGEPPLHIRWIKDGSSLQTDDGSSSSFRRIVTRPSSSADSSASLEELVSELSLVNAASGDEGLYECAGMNVYGEQSDSILVQVQDIPHPPADVRLASAVGSRRVQLEWRPPSDDGGSGIQHFTVFYQSLTAGSELKEDSIAPSFGNDGQMQHASIGNLQPATSYRLYMTTSNQLGQSRPSSPVITFTTDEEVPEGAPRDLAVSAVHSRSFTLTWSPPLISLQHGPIHSYVITLDSQQVNRTVVTVASSSSSSSVTYQFVELRPDTSHVIYIQAVNNRGKGPPSSPPLTVRTAEDVPEAAPSNVACVALSSRSLQITWQPPPVHQRNGIIRGYNVLYQQLLTEDDLLNDLLTDATAAGMESGVQPLPQTTNTAELTVFLSNLLKFSNYSIQVGAFTSVGQGVKSEAVVCSTEEDVPDTPVRVKVIHSGPDQLTISWLPRLPGRPAAGQVDHFVVYCKDNQQQPQAEAQKWTVPATSNRVDIRPNRQQSRQRSLHIQVTAVSAKTGEGPLSLPVTYTFIGQQLQQNKIAAAIVSVTAGEQVLAVLNSQLLLPCLAVGDPPLQTTWQRDGRPVLLVSSFSAAASTVRLLNNGSLMIERLVATETGNYTCTVRNRNGQDSVTFIVTALTPPAPPQLRFQDSNWTSVTLQWSPAIERIAASSQLGGGRTRSSPTSHYFIKYRPTDGDWTEMQLPKTSSYVVGRLNCGTEYEFALMAASTLRRLGNSSSSNVVTARTKGSAPEFIASTGGGGGGDGEEDYQPTTSHSWTVNLVDRWMDGGCPIQQFVIRFRLATETGEDWIVAGAEAPPQSAFRLAGLQPSTRYVVRVTASNEAGSSHHDYAIKTMASVHHQQPPDETTATVSSSSHWNLLSDFRLAVPLAASSLALLLTLLTLILRQRLQQQRALAMTAGTGNAITSSSPPSPRCPYEHEGSDVSPYAVFAPNMTSSTDTMSSTRRMKTFLVDGPRDRQQPLEMSNYGTEATTRADSYSPTYDYIAPFSLSRDRLPPAPARPVINKLQQHRQEQSFFVPIIPAGRSGDWSNQQTLAVSQRL